MKIVLRIEEKIIRYRPHQYERWCKGIKYPIVPKKILKIDYRFKNQPNYHYGEMLTLYRHKKKGWKGFYYQHYWILWEVWKEDSPQFEGAKFMKDFFGKRLESLWEFAEKYKKRKGRDLAQPDLFLYNSKGEAKFVEVKFTRADKLSQEQGDGLVAIRHFLKTPVEVYRFAPFGERIAPEPIVCGLRL